jgi:acyl-[acyl carrier protein]--UDP-N-acetylglucosamine O-acyltransferase
MRLDTIHPTAIIAEGARLGRNVTVGAHTIVYENVHIGDDTVIGPHSILGEPLASFYVGETDSHPPLEIGRASLIRSHSILYAGSSIGEQFQCGHRVTIREGTRIGSNVRVGTLSDIQGDCSLGDYVRLHSNVHIGQKSQIGNYVWIFPYTVLTNDPHPPSEILDGVIVEDFAVIATMVVVLPGVRIGRDALVGAMSMVRRDVEAESVVVGNPAKPVTTVREIKSRESGESVYPWREHFERGMPWQGIGYAAWLASRENEPS